MPEGNGVKKWCIRVSTTVVGAVIILAVGAQVAHYARSGDTEDRALENEQRNAEQDKALAPILKIVEDLGKRAAIEDAELEAHAKLCRAGKLKDCDDCAEAGVELPACVAD